VIVEAVHIRIPPAGYKELALGAGYAVMNSANLHTYLIGHLSSATDDKYFEPALLALLNRGKLNGSFFLMYYVPLGDKGINQWLMDPLEVQYNVLGPVSLGLSSYYYQPDGGEALYKIGGKVSNAFRYGAVELAIRKVSMGGGIEFQLRMLVMF
jgi:hypothetical protein